MDEWLIEPFGRSHERDAFACGKEPLDQFLRSFVGQYERRNLGRTYVAVRPGEKKVCGYYTLSSGAISIHVLPTRAAKKLPRHAVPAALLGRLAVDQSVRGRGLGAALLKDALRRCAVLSGGLGIHAVEVVAIDEEAKRFYLKYGFVPLEDSELHLYLPIATIE